MLQMQWNYKHTKIHFALLGCDVLKMSHYTVHQPVIRCTGDIQYKLGLLTVLCLRSRYKNECTAVGKAWVLVHSLHSTLKPMKGLFFFLERFNRILRGRL